MKTAIIAYIATAISFLALDGVWLTLMSSRLYKPNLGSLMAATVQPIPAVLFYVLYIGGIVIFVVTPSSRVTETLWRGAAFGLIAYATYDLTNQATLRGWPAIVTISDLCWGMFVTATAGTLGLLAARTWG